MRPDSELSDVAGIPFVPFILALDLGSLLVRVTKLHDAIPITDRSVSSRVQR